MLVRLSDNHRCFANFEPIREPAGTVPSLSFSAEQNRTVRGLSPLPGRFSDWLLVHCHSLNLGCHWLCQCSSLLNDQGKNSKITGKASGTQFQNQTLIKHQAVVSCPTILISSR